MPEQERISADQAFTALQQLTADPESEEQETPAAEPAPESEQPAEETPADTETETTVEAPAESDDVASLKARLAEKEKEREQDQVRLKDIQDRYATNERIRTERFLKKATAVDRAAHHAVPAVRMPGVGAAGPGHVRLDPLAVFLKHGATAEAIDLHVLLGHILVVGRVDGAGPVDVRALGGRQFGHHHCLHP